MKYIKNDKIEKLGINSQNVCIVTDFDRTLTADNSEDSWAASANVDILGKDIVKEMDELYEIYRPIELDYSIPLREKEKHMEKWYRDCMDLYYKYNLTQEALKKSINKSNLIFRKGAKEFLQKTKDENIPVIILSAGIGNVIEQFLKENNCFFDNMYIISNFIEFDDNGDMKKFDNTKIIHTLNKQMNRNLPKKFEEIIKRKKCKILIRRFNRR